MRLKERGKLQASLTLEEGKKEILYSTLLILIREMTFFNFRKLLETQGFGSYKKPKLDPPTQWFSDFAIILK